MLPYEYVIEAIAVSSKLRREELHEDEIPLSLLALQQAEMNRDRKKHPSPYKLDEFFCWDPNSDRNTVEAINGAAVLELIKQKKFPNWALFCYKELVTNADKADPPKVLMLENENAIMIAPRFDHGKNKIKGCLVYKHSGAEQELLLSGYGYTVKLVTPSLDGAYGMIEDFTTLMSSCEQQ